MPTSNPPIIQLLNNMDFDENDFATLFALLQSDPACASHVGSHQRSTVWVCCQHSSCYWRRVHALPLLVRYGANVNATANNGFTPLLSLYRAWSRSKKESKRRAAWILIHECGAAVPSLDTHGTPVDIDEWLANM